MAKLDDLIQQKQQRDEDWKAKKTAEREELGQLSDDAVMHVTSEPGAYLTALPGATMAGHFCITAVPAPTQPICRISSTLRRCACVWPRPKRATPAAKRRWHWPQKQGRALPSRPVSTSRTQSSGWPKPTSSSGN